MQRQHGQAKTTESSTTDGYNYLEEDAQQVILYTVLRTEVCIAMWEEKGNTSGSVDG